MELFGSLHCEGKKTVVKTFMHTITDCILSSSKPLCCLLLSFKPFQVQLSFPPLDALITQSAPSVLVTNTLELTRSVIPDCRLLRYLI